MKKCLLIFFVAISVFFVTPFDTHAFTKDNNIMSISNEIYLLEGINSKDEIEDLTDDYNNEEQDCSGNNSILGDPEDEDSVAWLLQQALNYIKVIGPILVVILSSFDFLLVIVNSNEDAMKKAQKKLGYRLVLAALLFFIPVIVNVLLDIFGITSDPTCGLN